MLRMWLNVINIFPLHFPERLENETIAIAFENFDALSILWINWTILSIGFFSVECLFKAFWLSSVHTTLEKNLECLVFVLFFETNHSSELMLLNLKGLEALNSLRGMMLRDA